jgi:hypothetical protein
MILQRRRLPFSAWAVLLFLAIGGPTRLLAQAGFHVNRTLYSETADAKAEIAAAEAAARREHKRILLEFGAFPPSPSWTRQGRCSTPNSRRSSSTPRRRRSARC